METVKLLMLVLGGVISLSFTLHKLKLGGFSFKVQKYDYFERLQLLCGSDASINLVNLRVAFRCVTTRELTPTEMEWFLYTPGAYKFIGRYGRSQRFTSIDIVSNRFMWNEKLLTKKLRRIELIKILAIYTSSGTFGSLCILKGGDISSFLGFDFTYASYAIGGILSIMALVFLYLSLIYQDSEYLIKDKL
ncbi:hypothetical protein [Moritella dasanensis]|uniref:hypothetical protein n=1 Tax=Moritella dasanensis TaxID=428031 RepID=UPI000310CBD2|nr:hypothetical protein [Moritella dasanensis]